MVDEGGVSQTTLDFIAEHTSDIILRAARDGKIIYISPSIRSYGYEPEDLLGRFPVELIHPEDRPGFIANSEALISGKVAPAEKRQHRLRRRDGNWAWIEGNPGVVRDDQGNIVEVVNVFRDVTRRRALEDQATLADAAFENATIGKVLVTLDRKFLRANAAFCAFIGRSEAELRELSFMDITHPDDIEPDLRLTDRLREGSIDSYARDKRYVRPDGSVVWGRLTVSVVRDALGAARHFLGNVQDLTDRRAADAALVESEARYRLIAENTSDMLVVTDLSGVVTYVSPSVRATGFEAADFVGLALDAFIPPAFVPAAHAARARLMAGSPVETLRWLGRNKEQGARIWMESKMTLMRDPQTGTPSGVLDVVREVTDQVAQEEALAAARAEAEAAAAVKTQFLANMSHEIRTPLTAVLGFAELLKKKAAPDERTGVYIDRIAGAGNALLAIVNDILDFSKLEAGKFEVRPRSTDILGLAEETLALFTNEADAKGLSLTFEADPGLPAAILIDADRVRQVLINLIGNAVKFTDRGGVVLRVAPAPAPAMRGVVLEVEDTGPGLAQDQLKHLFQRFSQVDGSTARRHGGTGLGLAICKGVTEAMGGEITVSSTPGQRTAFQVTIPAEPVEIATEPEADGPEPSIAGVRVAVIDDNASNRELALRMLEARGALASEASGGAEGLSLLAAEPFDAVLLDLRMPTIDGREVLRRLRAGGGPNRDVPVIAFTADAEVTLADPAGFAGLVRKPISATEMVAAVSAATTADDG